MSLKLKLNNTQKRQTTTHPKISKAVDKPNKTTAQLTLTPIHPPLKEIDRNKYTTAADGVAKNHKPNSCIYRPQHRHQRKVHEPYPKKIGRRWESQILRKKGKAADEQVSHQIMKQKPPTNKKTSNKLTL